MKLSTRIRYGTRALVCIAAFSEGRPVPLSEISRKENISLKYLESIITSLRHAGLVESVRGAEGGYKVNKPIQDIRLNEIVQALGGPISIVDCIGDQGKCKNNSACALFEVWTDLNDVIKEKLESIKLGDIVKKKLDTVKGSNQKDMYYI